MTHTDSGPAEDGYIIVVSGVGLSSRLSFFNRLAQVVVVETSAGATS
jgi:hypothetical protein